MKLALRIIILFLAALWIEQSLLAFLLPVHLSFRLMTLLIINLGFLRGPDIAAITGFLAGVFVSLLSGQPLGIDCMALTCVGWSAGIAAERLHMNIPGVALVLAFLLLNLEWLITYLMRYLLFDVMPGFSWVDLLCGTMISPLVFLLSRPFFARPNPAALYT